MMVSYILHLVTLFRLLALTEKIVGQHGPARSLSYQPYSMAGSPLVLFLRTAKVQSAIGG